MTSMHRSLNSLIDITIECLTNGGEVPADEVREHWKAVKAPCGSGGRAVHPEVGYARRKSHADQVINIVNRGTVCLQHRAVERDVHHALNNENIILD